MGQNMHSYTDKGKDITKKRMRKRCLEFLASKDDIFIPVKKNIYVLPGKSIWCQETNMPFWGQYLHNLGHNRLMLLNSDKFVRKKLFLLANWTHARVISCRYESTVTSFWLIWKLLSCSLIIWTVIFLHFLVQFSTFFKRALHFGQRVCVSGPDTSTQSQFALLTQVHPGSCRLWKTLQFKCR